MPDFLDPLASEIPTEGSLDANDPTNVGSRVVDLVVEVASVARRLKVVRHLLIAAARL